MTKTQREQAAIVLGVMASLPADDPLRGSCSAVAKELGFTWQVGNLAFEAWSHTVDVEGAPSKWFDENFDTEFRERYAEAQCKVLEGYEPVETLWPLH